MTIRHLRIFIHVAESGKMGEAARKLFISQPTVSQAIKELEEHYGVLLFQRIKKRLYITEEGKTLLIYAKDVVERFDNVEEKMKMLGKIEKIKIGFTITVGECISSNIINGLRARKSNVEIYSYVNNTQGIEEKLLKGDIDIGIIEGNVKSADLITIPKIKDYLVLICSVEHPFAKKSFVQLSELANENFAIREKGSGTRELFDRYMLKNEMSIKAVFEGSSPEAIKKEVIENHCLSVISIGLLQKELEDSKLHVIKNSNGDWNRYFSLVYHKDKVLADQINCMKSILDDDLYLKNYPDFESGILIR